MGTLIRDAGFEIRQISSNYVLVILQGSGSAAFVRVAELARKMTDVSEWISFDDFRDRDEKEQQTQTSKNKTSALSGDGNGEAAVDESIRAALEEELCKEDEKT